MAALPRAGFGGSAGLSHKRRRVGVAGRMWLMVHDTNKQPSVATALSLLRHAATAVAAGRVALGVAALARPSVPARPWVGASADELGARVFGRALGARDIALGLGALAAL